MQITFDTSNPSDLNVLYKLLAGLEQPIPAGVVAPVAESAAEPEPAPEVVAPKERKPRAKKEEVAPVSEAVAPTDETAGEASAAAASDPEPEATPEPQPVSDKSYSIDEVRAALQQFTAANGVPGGIELLKKFGAGRISELAEGDYASFVQACAA